MEIKEIKTENNEHQMNNTQPINIKIYCPYCNTESYRLVRGNKKWKCLDCHKSFKTPKIENLSINNTQSHIEATSVTVPQTTEFKDIIPDPELNTILDKLPNGGTPLINDTIPESLITNSKDIETITKIEELKPKRKIIIKRIQK